MKTILFAPEHGDLHLVPSEMAALANTLNAHIVNGNIGIADLFRELASGRWELIWFASHGRDDGVQLSDGMVDGDTLAAALRATNARLIVLNTCDSERSAEQIYAATGIPVVCNVGPVPDVAAFATASRFAQEIAAGHDVVRAFDAAKTRTFRLIPDNLAMYSRNAPDMDDIRRRIDVVEQRQRDHNDLLYGRPGQPGLVQEMSRLAERLGELRTVLWVMAVLLAATLATLAAVFVTVWNALL